MKILYLHQYFLTPEQGGAIRSYYLAKALVEKGYEVEIITSHNEPQDKTVIVEGITVHYLSVYYDNSLGFLGRVSSFFKFINKSYQKAVSIKGIDICYATSTPLTIGIIPLRLKKKLNIPYYFEVRDLWPEAPIQMGVIKNYFLKKYLFSLEKKIYKHAQKIIALSPGIRDGIEKLVPEKPIYLLPNISDCEFFHPEPKPLEVEKKFGVENKFVITYFGAIGKVNHLEFMMEAVKKCKERGLSTIHFLVIGKGSELERMKNLVHEYKLDNLTFHNFTDKAGLKEALSITDATYISFADKPILETNSPNKFFDAIASGKLCIVNTKGWIKEMIEREQCGIYADPHNANEFVEKIVRFVNDRSSLMLYQTNSRKLAESYFSRELQTEKFIRLFSKEEKFEPISPSAYTLTA